MANDTAFIDKLKTIVLENYTEEQFGVSDLVVAYGLSRSQLHRKLKSETGQSISQFIREIRLNEALKLLQENDLTASEVAYKVGFNSPTYFNTCFNEYFGYPPGETQLHMELAKSSNNSGLSPGSEENKPKKNRRVVIWLLTVTMVVLALFIYKYVTNEEATLVEPAAKKEKSIAVLPLKNWSGDVELEYITDGITDAIISKLAEIDDIDRVIPFTSMIRYKDTQKDLQEIATELNVAYVLEGNFKLSGEQVQSNLKLIEASTLEQVWNLEYIGAWKSNDIFDMQAAVAENVANTMSVNIASNEMSKLQYEPTTSEEAYRAYLKAEYQFNKLSKFGLDNSIGLYEEAIALDSTFMEPYIGLGTTYIVSGAVWGLMPQQEAWRRAKPILEHAYVLDSLRSGYNLKAIKALLLGGIFYYELDIQETEKMFKEVLSNPEGVDSGTLFDYARKTGRLEKAMEQVEKEIVNNPADGIEYMQRAFLHYLKGNTNAALELLAIYDSLYQDNYFYLMETSKWYYYMGELEKSRRHLQQLLEHHKDRPSIVYWLIAVHSEVEGDNKNLKSSLETLEQQYQKSQSGSPAWFLALYYFNKGDKEKGFNWLQKSYDRREVEMTWLKEEPMLKTVKKDPRYVDLYKKMGFQYIQD